jgi:hypothetical protein
MSSNHLYHTWFQKVGQMWSHLKLPQRRNIVWLIIGLYLGKSVLLSKIAAKIPGNAVQLSIERRLSRFLDNPAIRVRPCYDPLVMPLLQSLSQAGVVRLIVDGTKVGFKHQLLMVSVAYHRRAIPVAWTWVDCARGHSSASVQLALLEHVRRMLPAGATVLLVGDCEFGAVEIMRQLDIWQWKYALRQKPNHLVKLPGGDWQSFSNLVQKDGQSFWLGQGLLTAKHAYQLNLLAHWKRGEKEPWLLATNLNSHKETMKAYRYRMWIDEMFGDWKKHGFDLESTHLNNILKLSRLTLAVAVLYLWLVDFGAQVIKNSQRRLVDRNDRRDLSIFQIGLRSIERRLINDQDFSIAFCPIV